jgi:hypothetical protein
MRTFRFAGIAAALAGLVAAGVAFADPLDLRPVPDAAGQLVVTFMYMPPSEIEPTYHTVIWLEDKAGKLVKTLYVSQELSVNEYKAGNMCPDWVKQAQWAKAEKSLVDAVTGPTPNVGGGAMAFDLGKLGIEPGTYQFCFQVHVVDKYNILFRGMVSVGPSAQQPKIEVLYSPGKPPGGADIVRDVEVRYVPDTGK